MSGSYIGTHSYGGRKRVTTQNKKKQETTITHTFNPDVRVSYVGTGGNETAKNVNFTVNPVSFSIAPNRYLPLIPGSIKFKFLSQNFYDRNGKIIRSVDVETGGHVEAGTINYTTGIVTLTSYNGNQTISSANTEMEHYAMGYGDYGVSRVAFRVPGAPLRTGSLFVRAVKVSDGSTISATSDNGGDLDSAEIKGFVNFANGVVQVDFGYDDNGTWTPVEVWPQTIAYNAVTFTAVALDPQLIGVDPTRLPIDGTVPIVDDGDICVVHESYTFSAGNPTASQVFDVGQTNLQTMELVDANKKPVNTDQYSYNLATGILTMAGTIDLSSWTGPFEIRSSHEDMLLVTEVRIDGTISTAQTLSREYSTAAYFSSALILGNSNLQGRISKVFQQLSWDGTTWSDELIGNDAVAKFNDSLYPVEIDNLSGIQERWIFQFQTATTVNIIGEYSGVIATDVDITNVDPQAYVLQPVNPRTAGYYFRVKAGAFGSGWVPGNIVRINTLAANYPVWALRCRTPGPSTTQTDQACITVRGDSS